MFLEHYFVAIVVASAQLWENHLFFNYSMDILYLWIRVLSAMSHPSMLAQLLATYSTKPHPEQLLLIIHAHCPVGWPVATGQRLLIIFLSDSSFNIE